MKYDFDRIVDRRGTDSVKWNVSRSMFGSDDVLPMWVADMDFRAPLPVLNAIIERTGEGILGYTMLRESFYEAVADWFRRRFGWKIGKKWTVPSPGVVPAICTAIRAFTEPGDGVVYQPPVYQLFERSIVGMERKPVPNRLVFREREYSIDFDDLEEKLKTAKMMILCSPHNPVGRVWTRGELKVMAGMCAEHDVLLFSDEIHADLVYPGYGHVPAGAAGTAGEKLICAYSIGKTFNLAGLGASYNIIPGKETRKRFEEAQKGHALDTPRVFDGVALEAAYRHGVEWLDELLSYLRENCRMIVDELPKRVPGIKVTMPQATYLLWLDCRDMGMSQQRLERFFASEAGLGLNTGTSFGPGGEGFMRMNVACPRSLLEEALERVSTAWKRLKNGTPPE